MPPPLESPQLTLLPYKSQSCIMHPNEKKKDGERRPRTGGMTIHSIARWPVGANCLAAICTHRPFHATGYPQGCSLWGLLRAPAAHIPLDNPTALTNPKSAPCEQMRRRAAAHVTHLRCKRRAAPQRTPLQTTNSKLANTFMRPQIVQIGSLAAPKSRIANVDGHRHLFGYNAHQPPH